ncbi:MAG: RHS repeat domain-containing protein, partial [Dokdonella sp.]|uniref:RHS repeat domain-containing protein n=1 Tax=Dokdonella sp. TaxID=2291710 RepID=UPI003F802930
TYTRDALGRVQSITWQASGGSAETLVGSAAYLPFGPLTTLTFGNGRTLTKAYDQDYAIDSISGTPTGALTLDLGVDVMGDITSASATLGASPADRVYGYDALYRLKTSQTGASSPLEAYTYNKTGDRTSASLNGGAASAYTYTTGTHHLASVGGVARTYDGNGNTLMGTSPGLTLAYDDRNRLASAADGTMSATYAISGRGERVGKTVTQGGTPTTTLFAYDEGGRLIGEYDGAGTLQAEYIYLDAIPVGVSKGGVLYYVETDHLGTPRQVVKPATNTVVWKWDFMQNTFGNSVPDEDADGDSVQFVATMRLPGQYSSAESGLSYNYFRDYESITGRYVESDPVGLRAGVGTYGYVKANPLMFADPKGLEGYGSWTFPAGYKKEGDCSCKAKVANGTLGAGGVLGMGVMLSADSGVAIDTQGNVCLYSMLCGAAIPTGGSLGSQLGLVGGGGTGRLCSGQTWCWGAYRSGGAGVAGEWQGLGCADGGVGVGRLFGGVGESVGGGFVTCKFTLQCFRDSPCCGKEE